MSGSGGRAKSAPRKGKRRHAKGRPDVPARDMGRLVQHAKRMNMLDQLSAVEDKLAEVFKPKPSVYDSLPEEQKKMMLEELLRMDEADGDV